MEMDELYNDFMDLLEKFYQKGEQTEPEDIKSVIKDSFQDMAKFYSKVIGGQVFVGTKGDEK